MGLAAFNRMRREQAEREAVEKAKLEAETVETTPVTEEPTIDEVKAMLNDLGVKYSHNTSEAKLREKLKQAL